MDLYCIPKFSVNSPVTIVTINMFTHSMTTLNKTEYMWIHILILDTLKIMCAKNLSHIFMLTYFTSLSFRSFDAVIIIISRCKQEVNCFGHVTICTNHVTHCTFKWDPLFFPYLLKHQSVRYLERYKWKVVTGGIKWVNCSVCSLTELNYFYYYKKIKMMVGAELRWASDITGVVLYTVNTD